MSAPPLPTGCHDAASAARVLGCSKKALLKMLRQRGWLGTGGRIHNQPRQPYVQRGWLTTQLRSYALKGAPGVVKTYSVMLITQTGMQALQTHNAQGATATMANAPATQQPPGASPAAKDAAAPQKTEREIALEQLREWGLVG